MLIDHVALFVKEQHGGNVADAIFHTQVGVLVHIVLADDGTALIGGSQFLNNRGDTAAGTAPGCPEVNHDGFSRFQ